MKSECGFKYLYAKEVVLIDSVHTLERHAVF